MAFSGWKTVIKRQVAHGDVDRNTEPDIIRTKVLFE
jgi:hypothetical protein